jgi:hypothetical protein
MLYPSSIGTDVRQKGDSFPDKDNPQALENKN